MAPYVQISGLIIIAKSSVKTSLLLIQFLIRSGESVFRLVSQSRFRSVFWSVGFLQVTRSMTSVFRSAGLRRSKKFDGPINCPNKRLPVEPTHEKADKKKQTERKTKKLRTNRKRDRQTNRKRNRQTDQTHPTD